MLDLPPDIPVISACQKAVESGWQEAEQCLFDKGFTFAEPNAQLEQIETDYWIATGLIRGETFEEAGLTGDTTEPVSDKMLEIRFETEMTTFASPFLLANFDNSVTLGIGDIHRVYQNQDGHVAALLYDVASTSLEMFSRDASGGFETLLARSTSMGEIATKHKIGRSVMVSDHHDVSTSMDIYYRLFPSKYPDTSSWDMMQIEPSAFQTIVHRPPQILFQASYTITHLY